MGIYLSSVLHKQRIHAFVNSDGNFAEDIKQEDALQWLENNSTRLQRLSNDEQGLITCQICGQSGSYDIDDQSYDIDNQKMDDRDHPNPINLITKSFRFLLEKTSGSIYPTVGAIVLFLSSIIHSVLCQCNISAHVICLLVSRLESREDDAVLPPSLLENGFCYICKNDFGNDPHVNNILCSQFLGRILFSFVISPIGVMQGYYESEEARRHFLFAMLSQKYVFGESVEKRLANFVQKQPSFKRCDWVSLIKKMFNVQGRNVFNVLPSLNDSEQQNEFDRCKQKHLCCHCLSMWVFGTFEQKPSCLMQIEQAEKTSCFRLKDAYVQWDAIMWLLLDDSVKEHLYLSNNYIYTILEKCDRAVLGENKIFCQLDTLRVPDGQKFCHFLSNLKACRDMSVSSPLSSPAMVRGLRVVNDHSHYESRFMKRLYCLQDAAIFSYLKMSSFLMWLKRCLIRFLILIRFL